MRRRLKVPHWCRRNGTPRQPLLVPAARARLRLQPDVPTCCLDGLLDYSHCWVIYVFHLNTGAHPAHLSSLGGTWPS